jgi:broad specificity phosphatase PhoE
MPQIILIRPGATDYDREGRIQGNLDIPLSAEGASEVARVIDELRGRRIEAVYASPSQPALQTAEAVSGALGIKLKKLDRMHNVNQGLWQGMCIDEVRRKQPKVYRQWQEQPESVCPPEGEMLEAASERVRSTMTKLLKRHKDGIIAMVVSEPLASLVRRFVSQDPLGNLWKAVGEHGDWEILEVQPAAILHGT